MHNCYPTSHDNVMCDAVLRAVAVESRGMESCPIQARSCDLKHTTRESPAVGAATALAGVRLGSGRETPGMWRGQPSGEFMVVLSVPLPVLGSLTSPRGPRTFQRSPICP